MIWWCRQSNSSEAGANNGHRRFEHFRLWVFASNNKLTLAYLYKKLTITDNGCLGAPIVQTCHWFKAFWTCSVLQRDTSVDAIVWTLKLNYSRTSYQNLSGDQRSGWRLREERLLLSLKQKFLIFFFLIRHGDRRWIRIKAVPIDINPFITHPAHDMKGCTTPTGSTPPTYEYNCTR